MIVLLSAIAIAFFKKGRPVMQFIVFLILFAGVVCFGAAISRVAQNMNAGSAVAAPHPSVDDNLTRNSAPPSSPLPQTQNSSPFAIATPVGINQEQKNENGTAIQIGNARDVSIAPTPKD